MPNSKRQKPAKKIRNATATVAEPALEWSVPPVDPATPALHEMFTQQITTMLDNANISDEQRQNILVAMSCPCCGTGMSYSVKLK